MDAPPQSHQPNSGLISQEALVEFKRIYKEQYGEDISDREAYDLAVNLMLLYRRLTQPLPADDDAA